MKRYYYDQWNDYVPSNPKRLLVIENPYDHDNVLSVVIGNHKNVVISISDEKAMDSYNELFECSISLPKAKVAAIVEALSVYLGTHETAPNLTPDTGTETR